jgi:hypothetical protein
MHGNGLEYMVPYQVPVPNFAGLRQRVLRKATHPIAISRYLMIRGSFKKPCLVHPRERRWCPRPMQLSNTSMQAVPVRVAPNAVPIFCWIGVLASSQTQAFPPSSNVRADSPVDSEDRRQCVLDIIAPGSPSHPFPNLLSLVSLFPQLVSLAMAGNWHVLA